MFSRHYFKICARNCFFEEMKPFFLKSCYNYLKNCQIGAGFYDPFLSAAPGNQVIGAETLLFGKYKRRPASCSNDSIKLNDCLIVLSSFTSMPPGAAPGSTQQLNKFIAHGEADRKRRSDRGFWSEGA